MVAHCGGAGARACGGGVRAGGGGGHVVDADERACRGHCVSGPAVLELAHLERQSDRVRQAEQAVGVGVLRDDAGGGQRAVPLPARPWQCEPMRAVLAAGTVDGHQRADRGHQPFERRHAGRELLGRQRQLVRRVPGAFRQQGRPGVRLRGRLRTRWTQAAMRAGERAGAGEQPAVRLCGWAGGGQPDRSAARGQARDGGAGLRAGRTADATHLRQHRFHPEDAGRVERRRRCDPRGVRLRPPGLA